MDAKSRRAAILAFLLLLVAAAALAQDDIARHRSCSACGMDRKGYGFSRMLIVYEDGSSAGTCSLQCAVPALDPGNGKTVKSVFVADRDSRELIDAGKAAWVIGGSKRGVMTSLPKWAFATRPAAEAFVKAHGGKPATWEEAIAAARK